jgi:hypothetical protein
MKLQLLKKLFLPALIGALATVTMTTPPNLYSQSSDYQTEGDPMISAGGEAAAGPGVIGLGKAANAQQAAVAGPSALITFDGPNFDDNATENGVFIIPPDPHGAAGADRVISVVNLIVEARTKTGTLIFRDALRDFFAPVSPLTRTFDPKVIYDQYEDRFVVVTLELVVGTASVSPTNVSRILLAVSKDGTPDTPTAADWNFHAIDSKTVIPRPVTPFDHWADYPGLAVDEEAIYVTANMFTFVPFGSFGGVRLWLVDKGVGGGFYAGGPASVTFHNPYAAAGLATTTQPAHVFGAGGAGAGVGTYLVSYSGLSDGVDEYVQVVRVDNPLGATTFTQEFINIGNLEDFPGALPDAPQAGTTRLIEVNDRRALNAVWRDNALWMTAEIRPNFGPDLNQTTAHWWKLDTSIPGATALTDQANIGGEDIAPGTYTFFPTIAVNSDGDAKIGFSASAPTIFAGAYATGREFVDPPGTVQASETIRAGLDFYFRRFSGANNRWGDYSGIALDPTDDELFWVFNEYASTRGTVLSQFPDQDGRWATVYGLCTFKKSFVLLADHKLEFDHHKLIEGLVASNNDIEFDNGKPSALAGSVFAGGNVTVARDNTIKGNITAGGLVSVDPDAKVTGTVTENIPVGSVSLPVLDFANAPAGSPSVSVGKDQEAEVAPGVYNVLRADKDGALRLTSGTYTVNNLKLEHKAKLEIDLSGGDGKITINVAKVLILRKNAEIEITSATGTSEHITINYKGTAPVLLGNDSELQGTLVAPNALVTIGSGAGYQGSICAKEIEVAKGVHIRHHGLPGGIPKPSPSLDEETTITSNGVVTEYALNQNYPNPFNPSTKISFALPEAGTVKLQIYDMLGNLVRTLASKSMSAGRHEVLWNGRNRDGQEVAAGVYIYRLTVERANGEPAVVMTKKMTFLK